MKTQLRVFTSSFKYKGEERMDTTVKSGEQFVAPTWGIVMGHKNGTVSDEQYTQEYLLMLDTSMQNQPEKWIGLLRKRKVVLVCYCPSSECFCHRHILAMWLEKLGAQHMGEYNANTNVLIPKNRYFDKCLNQATQDMIRAYQPKKKSDIVSTISAERPMVVDPLSINTIQSSTCRDCKDNRKAMTWTPKGNIVFEMVGAHQVDVELGSRNISCCSQKLDVEGKPIYQCPIFQNLIDGYRAGVTSQGTNINPCKHCTEHMDNGGRCIGDRCPDGLFPIVEGAGLVKC